MRAEKYKKSDRYEIFLNLYFEETNKQFKDKIVPRIAIKEQKIDMLRYVIDITL